MKWKVSEYYTNSIGNIGSRVVAEVELPPIPSVQDVLDACNDNVVIRVSAKACQLNMVENIIKVKRIGTDGTFLVCKFQRAQ